MARHRAYGPGDIVIVSTHARQYRMRVLRAFSGRVEGRELYPGTTRGKRDSKGPVIVSTPVDTVIELVSTR
jgi:hypothetical protein